MFFFTALAHRRVTPQSMQIATLSIQSSELGPPQPHSQARVSPTLWVQGRDTLTYGGPNSYEGTDTLILYVL
jgi:hypothetical protein